MRKKLIYLLTALSYYATFPVHADTAEDDELFKAIWDHFGQKNSSVYADLGSAKKIHPEKWKSILFNWYGIESPSTPIEKHWHSPDRSDQNFENFVKRTFFVPFDRKFKKPDIRCNKYPHRSEALLYTDGVKWLDINIGGTHPYSITLWDWYNTVAIRSGSESFISHSKPTMYRWNKPVKEELIKAIMDTQQFEIYLEPNPLRIAGMLMNTEEKRKYKIPPKLNLKGVVYLPEEIKNCFK